MKKIKIREIFDIAGFFITTVFLLFLFMGMLLSIFEKVEYISTTNSIIWMLYALVAAFWIPYRLWRR